MVRPKRVHPISRLFAAAAAVALFASLFGAVAYAVVRQYRTADSSLKLGMAVALDVEQSKNSTSGMSYVERSSQDAAAQTIGVVVPADQDAFEVSSTSAATGFVQVASEGEAKVYVTDINGKPAAGDLLAPSPLRGILMRATEGAKGIAGVALQDFPDETAETASYEVSGSSKEAKIAIVGISLDVKSTTKASSPVNFLVKTGQVLVGHDISALQVFAALVILVLVIVVEGQLIYSAVGEYVSSLGRNPLAAKKLRQGLYRSLFLALIILVSGSAIAYGVLQI